MMCLCGRMLCVYTHTHTPMHRLQQKPPSDLIWFWTDSMNNGFLYGRTLLFRVQDDLAVFLHSFGRKVPLKYKEIDGRLKRMIKSQILVTATRMLSNCLLNLEGTVGLSLNVWSIFELKWVGLGKWKRASLKIISGVFDFMGRCLNLN